MPFDGARDCRAGGADPLIFDRDDAVGAVIDAGSFAGLVGDLGRGLLNMLWGD